MDRVYRDAAGAARMGEAGYERMLELNISWDHVVDRLTST
jgi:hypothetical protein